MKCNTCNTPVSSTCVKYQGKPFYFSEELEDKTDLEEILQKLSKDLKTVTDLLNKPIDSKCLKVDSTVKTSLDYIQVLIDQACKTNNGGTFANAPVPELIDISSTTLAVGCADGLVTPTQAILLILNQLGDIQAQLGSNNNSLYLPNQ